MKPAYRAQFHLVQNLKLFGGKIFIIRPLFLNLRLESILEYSLHLPAEYSAGSTGIAPVKFSSRLFKTMGLMKKFFGEIAAGIAPEEVSFRTRGRRFCKAKSDNKYQLQFVVPLYPCLTGNLAYKFRKFTAIVVSQRGSGALS